jgi:hypothetical protein
MNDGWFTIQCAGEHLEGKRCTIEIGENPIFLRSREVKSTKMTIFTKGEQFHAGPNRIELTAVNRDDKGIHAKTEIVFFMPEPKLSTTEANGTKESL